MLNETRFTNFSNWGEGPFIGVAFPNTMDVQFCVDALEEAISRYGPPENFNTDQGSQFKS